MSQWKVWQHDLYVPIREFHGQFNAHTHGVVLDKMWLGHAMYDRYVYVVTVAEYMQTVNTIQNMF